MATRGNNTRSLAIDRFRLVVPAEIPVNHSEERDAFLLTLPNEAGVVFFSEYTCEPKVSKLDLLEFLQFETTRFFQECISRVTSAKGQPSTEAIKGSNLKGLQSVVALEDGRLWIFRLIGEVDLPSYVLLHWNGHPRFAASHVLKILHSLELNRAQA